MGLFLQFPTVTTIWSFNLFSGKVWWQFAGKCVLNFIQERNKRHTWPYIVKRSQDIISYVSIYTKHLTETIEDNNQKVTTYSYFILPYGLCNFNFAY